MVTDFYPDEPHLNSIFLNDLENFLSNQNVSGVKRETHIDQANIYLKLFILLYADNTVLFSETPNDFQEALNCFKDYCHDWKLKINVEKTKVMIFSKGNARQNLTFKIVKGLSRNSKQL